MQFTKGTRVVVQYKALEESGRTGVVTDGWDSRRVIKFDDGSDPKLVHDLHLAPIKQWEPVDMKEYRLVHTGSEGDSQPACLGLVCPNGWGVRLERKVEA